jgi:hypothetical protein
MTEGPLTHHLMRSLELSEHRPELAVVHYCILTAMRLTRKVHRERR